MELFIGPARHQTNPWTLMEPSHQIIFLASSTLPFICLSSPTLLLPYILLDKISLKAKFGLTQFLGAIAFAQQLHIFHLHSTDHKGVDRSVLFQGLWFIVMGYMLWTPS
ncbi:hypothetical protein COLO4_27475 [Corchorus olitorius]|uniref:Uncharacterized protein n=1 Tax=Corchorus olitorius TaxID=93759 RepID=A0A1R3HQY9_9ROSI|nr:hypothetical protein COLO4_27475 [Corchorus olitorius]